MSESNTFILYGSFRSGSNLAQLLLDQHASVVTAPNTKILAFYLSGCRHQWRQETEGADRNVQGGVNWPLQRLLKPV